MTDLDTRKVWTSGLEHGPMPANQKRIRMFNGRQTIGIERRSNRTEQRRGCPAVEDRNVRCDMTKLGTDPFPSQSSAEKPASVERAGGVSKVRTLFPFPCFLLVFLLLPLKQLIGSQGFEVACQLSYKAFSEDAQVTHEEIWTWNVKINGPLWSFEGTNIVGGPPRELIRSIGTDGTNAYSISEFAKPERGVTNNYIPGLAQIRNAFMANGVSVPYPDESLISPLWFAYGSGEYLTVNKSSSVKPVWYHEPDLFVRPETTYVLELEKNVGFPFLPERATFRSNGKIGFFSDDGYRQVDYPDPFKIGFTNAVFIAGQFVTRHGISVPGKFRLQVYCVGGSETNPSLHLCMEFEGSTLSIRSLAPEPSTIPSVSVPTLVEDWRFHSRNGSQDSLQPLSYVMSNAWMTSTSDPAAARIIEANRYKNKVVAINTIAPHRRKGFVWFLGSVVLLPAVVFFWVKLRKLVKNKS